VLGSARRPDRADHCALLYALTACHRRRAEVDERDRVAFGRLDRNGEAVRRHRADERDHSPTRGDDGLAGLTGDVDAAVLPGGVRVSAVSELGQDGAWGRPRPRARGGGNDEKGDYDEGCSQ
jgi:hypothetical protein